MGEAKRRGDYEARKSEAIDAGRIKRPCISKNQTRKQVIHDLIGALPESALVLMYAAMSQQKHCKR